MNIGRLAHGVFAAGMGLACFGGLGYTILYGNDIVAEEVVLDFEYEGVPGQVVEREHRLNGNLYFMVLNSGTDRSFSSFDVHDMPLDDGSEISITNNGKRYCRTEAEAETPTCLGTTK